MQSVSIGIDLGTTYSLVSVFRNGKPEVLPNANGELLTPSVVSLLEDDSLVVGSAAKNRLISHPDRTCALFKRLMGTTQTEHLGGKEYRPEELSAMVLRTLKEDAESVLGVKVREAVVTVPAYFGELQRRATRDACEIAGLNVERIINEPTAAALAFGLHAIDREIKAVVLDLGGGTFDVTTLEIIEGIIEIQSTAGDARLGGEDFTETLAMWMTTEIEREFGSKPAPGTSQGRLLAACEAAKKRLGEKISTQIMLSDLELSNGTKVSLQRELTRDTVAPLWEPVIRRLRGPIARALRDAGWDRDVDEVLLVGGATRMPEVLTLATEVFGRSPLHDLPPDEAVALGAAIQAALKDGDEAVGDLVVTDVAPFTLGTEIVEDVGTQRVEGIFLPIIDRGTVLPVSRTKEIAPAEDFQTQLVVKVYQGESSLCSKNTKLGEYTVKGIPRSRSGDQQVEVRYTYDLNGILEVESTILSTGRKETLVIERSPGRLSKREVKEATLAMKRLKFHPREALPNTTALSKADALHEELKGHERELLRQTITQFRAALENQDNKKIEDARSKLAEIMNALK